MTDLRWAVRQARARLVRHLARERQAGAFVSYGLDLFGQPLIHSATADYLELHYAGTAEGLERALDELDGYLAVVGLDPEEL